MTTCVQLRRPYAAPLPDRGEAVWVADGEYTIRHNGWLVVARVPAQTGIVEGWYAVMDDLQVVMNVRVTCELVGPHPVYGA